MRDFGPLRFMSPPPVIKNLLIINGLVFLAQMAFRHSTAFDIEHYFALHDVRSVFFKPHQLITYMFLHSTLSFDHILFNMLALWMFGSQLEMFWGSKRFLIFYMVCGIGAGLMQLGVQYMANNHIIELFNYLSAAEQEELRNSDQYVLNVGTLGASGAIFGCLAAFGYLFPNQYVYIYALIPLKAKWLVLLYGGLEVYLGIKNAAGDSVAHWAHIGGALVGIILVFIWNKTDRRHFY
ncbi:MAG: rhomboid family intramembrane serine protease [Bacteroidetes bacterium]|nr:rhomboid family intramembrane serine protease [Bacteroidota bacterium]